MSIAILISCQIFKFHSWQSKNTINWTKKYSRKEDDTFFFIATDHQLTRSSTKTTIRVYMLVAKQRNSMVSIFSSTRENFVDTDNFYPNWCINKIMAIFCESLILKKATKISQETKSRFKWSIMTKNQCWHLS